MQIPFVTGSYEAYSKDAIANRLVNLYLEIIEGEGKTRLAAYGTPGLEVFIDFGAEPVRGHPHILGDYMYLVQKGTFYRVDNSGTKTSKGTLNTLGGYVEMSDNGKDNGQQICLVDGTNIYIYDIGYDTFFQVKQYSTGTTTGTTANKLVDSGATFETDGVKAGMIVYNTTDSTSATVTAVDSETQLSVSSDVFASGEDYEVGDGGAPDGATTVTNLGGRFIFDATTTGRYQWSALYDGTQYSALDFATAESDPDALVKVKGHNDLLYLFGEWTLEPHYQTGDADLPYLRVGGAVSQVGCAAKQSVSVLGSTLAWLGKTRDGGFRVYALQGNQPQVISNPALERKIAGYERDNGISNAVAYSYSESGHTFYVLQFPSEGKVHVFDMSIWQRSQRADLAWHERESDDGRHLGQYYAHFINEHIVTDYSSGKVCKMRDDIYTDNGEMKKWRMATPEVFADNKMMFFGPIEVIFDAGQGLTTGQGSDPLMSLRYSDDGGYTWSNKKERSMGKKGEYRLRARWNRNGKSRQRMFELSGSEPIKTVILGATGEINAAQ